MLDSVMIAGLFGFFAGLSILAGVNGYRTEMRDSGKRPQAILLGCLAGGLLAVLWFCPLFATGVGGPWSGL